MAIGTPGLTRRRLLQVGVGAIPALALGVRPAQAQSTPPVTGTVPPELQAFDDAMKNYIAPRNIGCAQLAVARHGTILLARGYGSYAVSTLVQPTSLFRIASAGKHITAAAVMRLVQDGHLDLHTPVTTALGLSTPADPRLAQVTVMRLMHHLGGWDRDLTYDPLWYDHTIAANLGVPLPIDHADIISYTTDRPLDFTPGSKMVYSNYGYMLLGRIIEQVSGLSYEAYVQQNLLTPVSVSRMRLGRSLKTEAAATEVEYDSTYTNTSVANASGAVVPYPYGGFNMPNQDANGGWLGSAVDLIKFATVFDAPGPVLDQTSLNRIFAVPETGVTSGGWWYGGGWFIRPQGSGRNTWHDGSMPGTYSFIARLHNGISYCAIFNRRQEGAAPDFGAIDAALGQAASSITTWPTTDLTPQYF
ncbi:CubicO group peptidase, beta-lactamase class C family [Sinosporangium album]|uniref:CubicO group peptidase, beta-lactamase class C family n=1 Tax=Sinosporangium album TaxID=504805 RepID=A0A1G7SKP1_9ACTN|nr:serine hydrolase domain-containing protein [Sinosporangium album]SDG22800.1 CubicO group peptidase, beta-lactamase class C family [Sinosporangium album]